MTGKSPFRGLKLGLHRLLGRKTTRVDGLTVTCDPALIPRSVVTALVKGSYEAPERQMVADAIRKGDRVVEIGTGVGVVSLLCNRLAGAGNVLSFEANASLEPAIRANFALNGMEPRLRLRAVTVDGAPISFYRNENIVSSSVYDRGLEAEKVTVESEALDAVLEAEQATVLVIDVEGAELALLACEGVGRLREIIVETHPHIVGEAETAAMVAGLQARGFKVTGRIHKNLRLSRAG
ncbi:FkbM family methyltransferase [Stagnihabitans tardus]|uniref:FkbM family methyltransferase n=1 Tax=Stagnihabitans tardus TaxID=2699202 RepID=A0AAE4YBC1_9RHOB|nr:FkbM family methyltransferase [Stagnihabitans tardus]NBZ89562.1 FkbM family methyltransferase [Stagnihabitans tardus]